MSSGVLSDQGQSETGTDPSSGRAASVEPLEDPLAFVGGNTRAGVLDSDHGIVVGPFDADPDGTTGVIRCILEEIGDDPLESDPIDGHR